MPVLVTALSALADCGNSNSRSSNNTAAAAANRGAGGGSSGSGNHKNKHVGSGGQKSLLTATTASVLVEKLEHVVESSAPIRASLKVSKDFSLRLLTKMVNFG